MNNNQYLVTDGNEFYKYNDIDYVKNKVRDMLNERCNLSDIEVYEIHKLDALNNNQYLVTDGNEFYKYNNVDYAKNKIREMSNECCNLSDIEIYEIHKLDISINVVINKPITKTNLSDKISSIIFGSKS